MKKKIIIVVAVFVVIAVVVTIVLVRNNESGDTVFPLQKGSTGDEVKKLQEVLNSKQTGVTIDEDGVFGTKTESLLVTVTGKASLTKREYKKLIA